MLIRHGIKIKLVTNEMQGQTVGYLLSFPGFSKETVEEENIAFEEDIMVLKGFTQERINVLFEGFKKNGIRRINLKAVVTEHNLHWKLRDLYNELREEHKQMSELRTKKLEEANKSE